MEVAQCVIKGIVQSVENDNGNFKIEIKPTEEYSFNDKSVTNQNGGLIPLIVVKNQVYKIEKDKGEKFENVIVNKELNPIISQLFIDQRITTFYLMNDSNGWNLMRVELA